MTTTVPILTPDENQFELIKSLAPEDVEAVWVDYDQPVEQLAAALKDAVAIVLSPSDLSLELARALPNLRLAQVVSAGTDRMDLMGLGELGIRVANCGGGNSAAVSEHAIALMLSVYRKLRLQFESAKAGRWVGDIRTNWQSQAHELTEKTIGIIGLGRIGQQVARRLQGWECRLVYDDAIAHPPALEEELGVTKVSRDELLKTADVITLHVPLMGETRAIISDRELEMMKPTAVLINCSRGEVVDEAALVRALQDGKIGGAGLDVLEQEPTPADNPLLDMDNVVVTPHMASFAIESQIKSRSFAIQNAARVAGGEEPESVVLPE